MPTRSLMSALTRVCFFQAEDGIRYLTVTGVQTCALPISAPSRTPKSLHVRLSDRQTLRQTTQLQRIGFKQYMDRFMPQWRQYRDELNRAPLAHEIGRASCRERV